MLFVGWVKFDISVKIMQVLDALNGELRPVSLKKFLFSSCTYIHCTLLLGIWWNGRGTATHRGETRRARRQSTKVCRVHVDSFKRNLKTFLFKLAYSL